jgi:hypothetical protein
VVETYNAIVVLGRGAEHRRAQGAVKLFKQGAVKYLIIVVGKDDS